MFKHSWLKFPGDVDDLGNGDEDEMLTELQKEYESEDCIGENIQNPQFAKLLGKMFRNRLPDKVLKEKLERQARPENCETVKPTRVNPSIWRKLRKRGTYNCSRCSKPSLRV